MKASKEIKDEKPMKREITYDSLWPVPGDIGLIKGKRFKLWEPMTWISSGIRYFMRKYNKRKGYPADDIYTHAFTFIDIWGNPYVAEALREGITIQPFEKAYSVKDHGRIKILSPADAYDKTEKELISKTAIASALVPTRYDIMNFFYQIILVLSGRWIGPKGKRAEKRLYCSEACATWANKVRADTFKNPAATNPLDVDLNEAYIVKVENLAQYTKKKAQEDLNHPEVK